jgi:hypothetical protein
MKDENFYTTMGKVLIEKTMPALEETPNDSFFDKMSKKVKRGEMSKIANNDLALSQIAKTYEHNVENSDDPELIAQHESIVIEVRGRLGIE